MRWVLAERRAGPDPSRADAASGSRRRASAEVPAGAGPDALRAALSVLAADADVLRASGLDDAGVTGNAGHGAGARVRPRAMVETDLDAVRRVRAAVGDAVRVEPEILHAPAAPPPTDFLGVAADVRGFVAAAPTTGSATLAVTVLGGGAPLGGAELTLYLRSGDGVRTAASGVTDADGRARFAFPPLLTPAALVVVPANGFWSLSVRGPRDGQTVDCPALPADGPVGWWHESVGVARPGKTRGRSVRVGVIDTGVGPHPCLEHVIDAGSFVGGAFDPAGGADVGSHGTHVCGIVGARPVEAGRYAGVAPGARLYSARVFPPDGGANQMDISDALDALSAVHEVDLANLSLGAPVGSEIERDAILDALERGTLCVCAAGNEAGAVSFPAAFAETVAVSALGAEGRAPPGTLSASRLPGAPGRFGDDGLYLASFSCFGPEIGCAAPGVGIVSTVPARPGSAGPAAPYAAMDGTSMASPLACGALAAILAGSGTYRAMPRGAARAALARRLLRTRCRDIGLDPVFQGRGVPSVGAAVAGTAYPPA